jgi:hypothetical protein
LYAESGTEVWDGGRKGDSGFQLFAKRKPQVKGGESKSAPFKKRRVRHPKRIVKGGTAVKGAPPAGEHIRHRGLATAFFDALQALFFQKITRVRALLEPS